MTEFEKKVASWLIKRIVNQGNHAARITELYSMIRTAAVQEFTEDNKPTLDSFLQECFDGKN